MTSRPSKYIDSRIPDVLWLFYDKHASVRQIAKRTKLARATVAAIIARRRVGPAARRAIAASADPPFDGITTCPHCHVLLHLPCPSCAAKAYRLAHGLPQ